jgi:hypothetical protein
MNEEIVTKNIFKSKNDILKNEKFTMFQQFCLYVLDLDLFEQF